MSVRWFQTICAGAGTKRCVELAAINFGNARWARVTELGPGRIRIEVWPSRWIDVASIQERMSASSDVWRIVGVKYRIDPASIWTRVALHFLSIVRRSPIFDRFQLGGMFR